MPRYSPEQKAEALVRVDEIGARKACEELNIAYQTILKWRNERDNPSGATQEATTLDEPMQSCACTQKDASEPSLEEQVRYLTQENKYLRLELAKCARAIQALTPAIHTRDSVPLND